MSFFRLQFLNAYILVVILTIIAGDHTYYQETSRKERSVYFENSTLQQYGGQTAEVSLPNYHLLHICCICFLVSSIFRIFGLIYSVSNLYNVELKRIWKEAVTAYSKYCRRICLEALTKTTKWLSQVTWSPGRDSK